MLAEMSSRQLSEWMAFAELEPFGFKANLFGHAVTTSTTINLHLKKGVTPYTPDDVIEMVLPRERKQTSNGPSFFKMLKDHLKRKIKGQ